MGYTCYVCDSGFQDFLEFQAHLGTHPGRQEGELDASDLAHATLIAGAARDLEMRKLEHDALPDHSEDLEAEDRALLAQERTVLRERLQTAENRHAELTAGHDAVKAQKGTWDLSSIETMTYDAVMGTAELGAAFTIVDGPFPVDNGPVATDKPKRVRKKAPKQPRKGKKAELAVPGAGETQQE